MKKVFIGCAMAAALLASSVVPALAADKTVSEIKLTIDAPVAGEPVSTAANVSLDSEGIKLCDKDAVGKWMESDSLTAPVTATFESGKSYSVSVSVCPEEGYSFSGNTLKLTVNGKTADGTMNSDGVTVYSVLEAEAPQTDATPDTAIGSSSDSASPDSGKNYDDSNNANGSIATNEGNATLIIFAVVIGIAAAAGVAYFIITKRKK